MHDVLDELDRFGYVVLDEWFVLDSLVEFVNGHKNVLETTLGFLERSYLIQPPAGERPSEWDADQIVSWYMSLSCI